MNISQRLRTCAKHTGLDAVIELLQEAADEIDRLSASAALPTMRPGDSHMESLIEAAIQGHASTRDAMRWLVHQLVPHPSMATQAEVTDAALIRELVDHIERNTCTHEETHRGGAIWEFCDSCGARWADDEGGKPEFKWPAVVEKARAILALRPERVPMTDDERGEAYLKQTKSYEGHRSTFMRGVWAAEAHHGITAQAKKEGA